MAENSKIEWTDHTFNAWIGCTKVHEGCANCYAETLMDERYGKVQWGPSGTRVKTSHDNWQKPLAWNRAAEKAGQRARVFCASLADVFEDWDGPIHDSGGRVLWRCCECGFTTNDDEDCSQCGDGCAGLTMQDMRKDLFKLIDATPWLDWLLLTKRPQLIQSMWPCPNDTDGDGDCATCKGGGPRHYRNNVWLGTSISLQPHANTQIPELLKCRDLTPVLFLSIEPLLGPINLNVVRDPNRFPGCAYFDVLRGRMIHEDDDNRWTPEPHIDWVIVGGESGPHARPMHSQWVRDIRDECCEAAVPFFFKQWGEFQPSSQGPLRSSPEPQRIDTIGRNVTTLPGLWNEETDAFVYRVGKKEAGRLLDGRDYSEFPEAR